MFWFKNAKGLLGLFLFVIFSCSSVFAQTGIMEYGFVDTSDLKMTTCAIDREAPAMFLFDTGELWYMSRMGRYFNTRIKRHVRIKILKDNGLKWANVKLYYENYKSYEVIENLRGITYNLSPNGDIETVPLEAVNIYDKPINKYVSSVVFSMPNVKVGSIIEYEYELQRDDDEDISEWSFQDIIPTRFSRFDIRIPQYYEFTTQSDKLFPIEIKDSVRKESAVLSNKLEFYKSYEKIYNASNIPGFVDEPMMATHGKRYQSIRFQFSGYKGTFYRYGILNSWPEFAKALFKDNDYIEQLKTKLHDTDPLDAAIVVAKNDYEKMNLVYNYVRKVMNYNDQEYYYCTDDLKKIWKSHIGGSGDINMILINLLQHAGLKASPVLARSRYKGPVMENYPFLKQFNNTLALVNIGDRTYILDAVDKYNPANLVPYEFLNTRGFLLENEKGSWLDIVSTKETYKRVVAIEGEITGNGIFKANATVTSFDYDKNPRVEKWLNDEKDYYKLFASANYPLLKLANLKVENAKNDSLPLVQTFDCFTSLNQTGDYLYFNTNLFLGMENNPFVAEKRYSDIDFGYKQNYLLYGTITIPDNYQLDASPKNVQMMFYDSSIVVSRFYSIKDNQISFRVNIDFKRDFYNNDEYPDLKEFYKKLFAILNEQIVLKKK